jgi:D-arabinose 1-dehydrogenase-like Zn-dependent alcohol dehydrogenase
MTIPTKSRAAVIAEYNKPYEIREFSIPEVEPGAILVKIEMAGVCGTDVHQLAGELGLKPKLPVIPGHPGLLGSTGGRRRQNHVGPCLLRGMPPL